MCTTGIMDVQFIQGTELVGRASLLLLVMSFVVMERMYNGSTLSILGRLGSLNLELKHQSMEVAGTFWSATICSEEGCCAAHQFNVLTIQFRVH